MRITEIAIKYANIVRGEADGWSGDPVRNGESYAFEIGRTDDDAQSYINSLTVGATQLSTLSGLPPSSLKRLRDRIIHGMRSRT